MDTEIGSRELEIFSDGDNVILRLTLDGEMFTDFAIHYTNVVEICDEAKSLAGIIAYNYGDIKGDSLINHPEPKHYNEKKPTNTMSRVK